MTSADVVDRDQGVRAGSGGFTLVEVVVAIVILAAGIVALASATSQIVREISLADLQSERTVAFQAVIDRLQALPYDDVDDGTTTIGVYDVSWTVTPMGAQSKIVDITTVGPGVGETSTQTDPNRSETFEFRILRR